MNAMTNPIKYFELSSVESRDTTWETSPGIRAYYTINATISLQDRK
jgi:hypothetical protein